jgi:hypothetical protein
MPSATTAERRAPKLSRPAAAALAALACLALLAPAPAAAQDRSNKPSAAGIRNAYPLEVKPDRSVRAAARTPEASAQPARRPPAEKKQSSGSSWSIPLFAVLALAAFGAGFVVTVKPLRLRRAPGSPEAVVEPAADGLPPAPQRPWTAEVRWQQLGEACVFAVVARSAFGGRTTVIAQSQPLDWPPVGATAVERVAAAAKELEASLVSSGWRPLPPGDAWYAKRFAWEPAPRAQRFDRPGTRSPRAVPARRNGAS